MTVRLVGSARLWPVLALSFVAAAGCSSLDPGILEPTDGPDASGTNGRADAGPTGGTGGVMPAGSGGVGGAGTGGAGGGGEGGSGGSGGSGGTSSSGDCVPNPNPDDEVCTEICPETCDNVDNDCDRRVDEGEADDECAVANTTAACARGECVVVACDGTWRDCDMDAYNGCEAPEDDVDNCGTCGHVCVFTNAIPACMSGDCEPIGCIDLFVDCDSDPLSCETPSNTLANCGDCGAVCENVPNATADCTTGVCGPGQCADGFDDCDGNPMNGCEQVLTALQHCGKCATPCDFVSSTGDSCDSGTCVGGTCKVGYDDCDGDMTNGCESLESDAHCGSCGLVCDGSLDNVDAAGCTASGCGLTCAGGFGDCDDDPFTGCEASTETLARCGDCDTPCAIPHAVASCVSGGCSFVRCDEGWADCNTNLGLDGCETDLDDPATCGSCINSCSGPTPYCAGGTCSGADCSTPPGSTQCGAGPSVECADCDLANNDCETDVNASVSHCGACGNVCAFTTGTPHANPSPICVDGQCEAVCHPLWADCNGDYTDGCEQSLETLTSCGACGIPCSISGASETCAGGTCAVDNCETDQGDCDADPLTCETPLDTIQDCGFCDNVCNQTNATVLCSGDPGARACQITSCTQTYFGNCDGLASTGCEVDKRTSTTHCGNCGFSCLAQDNVASATCSSSSCNFTCDGGFGDCNNMDNDGCEQSLNTLNDCAACGTPCSRTNGTASCSSGSCQLTGCDPNYLNCDGNAANGCEPLNTTTNCGACGSSCTVANGTGSCATMSCVISACNANWDNCDGDVQNGCEQDIRTPASGGLGPCFPEPTGCTKQEYNGATYYFCTAEKTWTAARDNCRLLAGTELVRIDDMAENDFVQTYLSGANAWIGGNDRTADNTWRWTTAGSDDGSQFFTATGAGMGNTLLYARWNSGEPNEFNGNEDCAEIRTDGLWNDENCASTRDYVCEQNADLCPTSAKTEPGICGCDTPDTDTDSDGTPDCNDGCPNDMDKTAPGICDCGTPDDDTDSDGTVDCMDGCPTNPAKTVAPCSWQPDNYDPALYTHTAVVDFNCGGTHTFNSTSRTWDTACCGTCPAVSGSAVAQPSGGPSVVILSMQSLNVASGTTIRLIGDYPVVFSVDQNATIGGTIDAGSRGAASTATDKGAGANDSSCGGGNGGNGGTNSGRGGGGGGGGFGTNGGTGGGGSPCAYCCPGNTAAGTQNGTASLVPLRGGCKGGTGGASGAVGGGGGGAFQLAVQGTLTVSSTGVLSAAGGGGIRGSAAGGSGGGGGGSGGAVLIQYAGGYSNTGALRVHGGGGGEGSTSSSTTGNGENGHLANDTRAAGGTGGSAANGGLGGTRCVTAGSACTAADASPTNGSTTFSLICVGDGASGGGGGVGRAVSTQK